MQFPVYKSALNTFSEIEQLLGSIPLSSYDLFYETVEKLSTLLSKLNYLSMPLSEELNEMYLAKSSTEIEKYFSVLIKSLDNSLTISRRGYSFKFDEVDQVKQVDEIDQVEQVDESLEARLIRRESQFQRFFKSQGYVDIDQLIDDVLAGTQLPHQYYVCCAYSSILIELKDTIERKFRFLILSNNSEGEKLDELPYLPEGKYRSRLILLYETGVLQILKDRYKDYGNTKIARLICVITGITDPTAEESFRKDIDNVLNNTKSSGKGGYTITKRSVKPVLEILSKLEIKPLEIGKFDF